MRVPQALQRPRLFSVALSAAPLLGALVASRRPGAMLVGPDEESAQWVAQAAQAHGLAAFQAHLGSEGNPRTFALEQPGTTGMLGAEISPYTQQPLHIRYPQADVDRLFDAAQQAIEPWAGAGIEQRIGVLMEVVERLYADHLFELTHAVMHTAGQSFNMAYAGSGVNALDRAIEALVYAEQAMRASGKSGLSDAEVEDYVRRFLPAYELWRADAELSVTLDAQRRPTPGHTS